MRRTRTGIVPSTALAVVGALVMSAPLSAQSGTLFVEGNKVGIGIASPFTQLHLDSETNNGNVVLIRSTDDQMLFRLYETTNTGGVLSMFDNAGTEDFRISAEGDSWFASAGQVGFGCKTPDAALTVGTTTNCNTPPYSKLNPGEATFTTSSSRTVKENLVPVAVPNILEQVAATKVYTFDFIGGPQDRIGLMAEDFHQIFRRGSDKTLSGQEVEMALWLAVQELTARNELLARRLRELEAKLEPLD